MRKTRRKNRYISGDNNVISDMSGFKFKRSECVFTWDGFLVHKSEWDSKQPQLDIKGRDEQIGVSVSRPRQPDRFFVPTRDDL